MLESYPLHERYRYLTVWCSLMLSLAVQGRGAAAQAGALYACGDSIQVEALPEQAWAQLDILNVKDADLRDILRGIAQQYDLNLVVDNRIQQRITLRLAQLPVIEAVTFLCRQYGLTLTQSGQILRLALPPEPPPTPDSLRITLDDGMLSVDLEDEDLERVMNHVAQLSGLNIIVHRGVRGVVSGTLRKVPLLVGLRTLIQSNGFVIRHQESIWYIDIQAGGEPDGARPGRVWMQVVDSLITLDVAEARVADVLREVADQAGIDMVVYALPEVQVTARVEQATAEEVLNLLFKGSDITYRSEDGRYVIGNKGTRGIAATRLIRLGHIRADEVLALVPDALKEEAAIQVVRVHNGLLVTGTHDVILELEALVRELDAPTPQILIEALVIDFRADDLFELGMTFGRDGETAAQYAGEAGFRFEGHAGAEAGLHVQADGERGSRYLDALTGLFGLRKIGRLPADFYVRLHALEQDGRVNIRSRPQVATLNGHAASISIGTTQYYILRTTTPYTSPGQVVVQETERFEHVEASVKLEVTPWVGASGAVTTEIRPEFSTPVGELKPDVPPTINSRVLESTVRLKDGETIILGGLIQDVIDRTFNKVPILGNIPLLGRLFRSTAVQSRKSELVIFLTPHIFYGDVRDEAKWGVLKGRLGLSEDLVSMPSGGQGR